MSADQQRMHLLGSFSGPSEQVEMMDDDDSSNDSDNDDLKSVNSEKSVKQDDDENEKPSYSNGLSNNMNLTNIQTDNDKNDIDIKNTNGVHQFNNELSDPDIQKRSTTNYIGETELSKEDEARKRFQIELEFVQSLANPNYLNFLAQRGYFRNQTFLNYLKYLMYWTKPEYVEYIMYPQCLSLLELLQHEQFLKEIVNAQCSKYIDEQLLLIWLHYKKKRDWIRLDPVKVPEGIEKLIDKTSESDIMKNTENILENKENLEQKEGTEGTVDNNNNDAFSAVQFLENEKF